MQLRDGRIAHLIQFRRRWGSDDYRTLPGINPSGPRNAGDVSESPSQSPAPSNSMPELMLDRHSFTKLVIGLVYAILMKVDAHRIILRVMELRIRCHNPVGVMAVKWAWIAVVKLSQD